MSLLDRLHRLSPAETSTARRYSEPDMKPQNLGPRPESKTTLKVGFYGCNGQVVRLGCVVPQERKAPQYLMVDCPSCGHRHSAHKPMWRKPHSAEEFELSHLEVEVPDA